MSNRLDTKLVNFKNVLNLTIISSNIVNYILTPKKNYNKNLPIFIIIDIKKKKTNKVQNISKLANLNSNHGDTKKKISGCLGTNVSQI